MDIQSSQQAKEAAARQIKAIAVEMTLEHAALLRRKMSVVDNSWKQLLIDHPPEDILTLSPEVQEKTNSQLVRKPPAYFKNRNTGIQGEAIHPSKKGKGKTKIFPRPLLSQDERQALMEHELVHAFQFLNEIFTEGSDNDRLFEAIENNEPLNRFSDERLVTAKSEILAELQAYRLALKRGLEPENDAECIQMYKSYYQAIKREEYRRREKYSYRDLSTKLEKPQPDFMQLRYFLLLGSHLLNSFKAKESSSPETR